VPKHQDKAEAGFTIHLLDMGKEMYGDCLVCVTGNRTILIDGGHPADYRGRTCRSIPDQLREILGHEPPFKLDLLVVTHCHSDHIGCLPTLIPNKIEADWALVADEGIGFGRSPGDAPATPDQPQNRLAALLREEDHTDLNDTELSQFLSDAATLESKYRDMLSALEQAGTKVVRFGRDDVSELERAFTDFGLRVLGPSAEHLAVCADAIAHFSSQAGDALAQSDTANDDAIIAAYRNLVQQGDAAAAQAEDRPGKGSALNDTSIVLKLEVDGAALLVAGDMQFAVAEVNQLTPHMAALRDVVKANGPYQLIKLTHHASYNGFNEEILNDWSGTRFFAHSGGSNDAGHPDPGVLALLNEHADTLTWARTDRNGIITATFPSGGVSLAIQRGELNDPTPNGDAGTPQPPKEIEAPAAASGPTVRIERVDGPTEVALRLGPGTEGVTLSFGQAQVAPRQPAKPADKPPRKKFPDPLPLRFRFAAGRRLPRLLFVTYRFRLDNNIGSAEAKSAIDAVRNAGFTVLEIANQRTALLEVRRALAATRYAGVVLLGGYDVLPAIRLDVLPANLRQQLGPAAANDYDNFIVWNDEAYGDISGDGVADLPVSRIPDAKSPQLVYAALSSGLPAPLVTRFGIRNSARPFADSPYNLLPDSTAMLVSAPTTPAIIGSKSAKAHSVYFMLHGSDADATRFWGEQQGAMLEAVNLGNVPASMIGAVFAGCCWGALVVDQLACLATSGQPLGIRTTGMSMALSYLRAGVNAFVGCTGTHYSPTVAPYKYFGGPMHAAFFTRWSQGTPPARALFESRIEYASGMPHGQTNLTGQAIEYKILRQFTCLGLGW
jgi:beta-lactamase superfamily II metal-dependent hydrolase